jgi:hypothetical protein
MKKSERNIKEKKDNNEKRKNSDRKREGKEKKNKEHGELMVEIWKRNPTKTNVNNS